MICVLDLLDRNLERLREQNELRSIEHAIIHQSFSQEEEGLFCIRFLLIRGGRAARQIKSIIAKSIGKLDGIHLPVEERIALGVVMMPCPREHKPMLEQRNELWLVGLVARLNQIQVSGHTLSGERNNELEIEGVPQIFSSTIRELPSCLITVSKHQAGELDVRNHLIIHDLNSLVLANQVAGIISDKLQQFREILICHKDATGAFGNFQILGNYSVICYQN